MIWASAFVAVLTLIFGSLVTRRQIGEALEFHGSGDTTRTVLPHD